MGGRPSGTPARIRLLRGATLLLLVALALAAGCARAPQARKARHLDRGDRYLKAEKYRDAIIEYRLGGKPDGARTPAEAVLEKHRKHVEAPVLAAEAASTPGGAC